MTNTKLFLISQKGDIRAISFLKKAAVNHWRIKKRESLDPYVRDVLMCIQLLFGRTDLGFEGIRNMLSEPEFLPKLNRLLPNHVKEKSL